METVLAAPQVEAEAPGKPVWSPATLAWFSIIFSILPAGIMATINLGRLGRKDLRWVRLSHYVLVFLILTMLRLAMESQGSHIYWPLSLAVNIGYARHFYESQRRLYDAHRARGGKRASIWMPALLCAVFFLGVLAIGLLWA
jgi:hypothetical protein